jgi:hypothetical protein
MIITIINVSKPEAVKKYFTMEVNYKDENGKVAGKKLMSFTFPQVFNTAKTLQNGDVVEVKAVKNDAGYWDWTEMRKVGAGEAAPAASKTQAFTQNANDRYETKEERNQRQIMIIRQSSLSNAINTLSVGAKIPPKTDDIIDLAKQFENYVCGKTNESILEKLKVDNPVDLIEDEIPY